jgi:transposase
MKKCSKCGSERTVKNGMKAGQQTYLCRDCGYRFMSERPKATEKIKRQAVILYCVGLSFRTIGVLLGYANTMILIWVREFAKAHYQKPMPKNEIILELDEMWHFLQSKKTNCGYGKHIVVQLGNLLTGSAEIEIPRLLKDCIID